MVCQPADQMWGEDFRLLLMFNLESAGAEIEKSSNRRRGTARTCLLFSDSRWAGLRLDHGPVATVSDFSSAELV